MHKGVNGLPKAPTAIRLCLPRSYRSNKTSATRTRQLKQSTLNLEPDN